VDVAQEPLRRARERHPELDLRLLPTDGPWPLADASFDVVWAGEVIEHVADTASWLSQLRRLLRSGGELLLTTPAHGRLTMLAVALRNRFGGDQLGVEIDAGRQLPGGGVRAVVACG